MEGEEARKERERTRVGSKGCSGEMIPGWVALDGHQEHSGLGSTELQHHGARLDLSPGDKPGAAYRHLHTNRKGVIGRFSAEKRFLSSG